MDAFGYFSFEISQGLQIGASIYLQSKLFFKFFSPSRNWQFAVDQTASSAVRRKWRPNGRSGRKACHITEMYVRWSQIFFGEADLDQARSGSLKEL
jgi:hypothetical protein